MHSFTHFLNALGGLHDAVVVSIDWKINVSTLEIAFDDLYANFRGLPEYPGRKTGSILFRGVGCAAIELRSDERLRVFEILPVKDSSDEVVARFSPSGRITVRFEAVEHPILVLSGDNSNKGSE
ncbi:MAG: hypothetical protein PHV02_07970 [Rhodocyclaceae bacterium]|nr:hypothetical protein [Rhodocyclaceae bacterium]